MLMQPSASVSPSIHGFHYAPARSPHQSSPSRISAAASGAAARRPSSPALTSATRGTTASTPIVAAAVAASSAASASMTPTAPASSLPPPPPPPPPQPPQSYVAVDATTQYSPMEPFDYTAHPSRSHPVPSASLPLDPPPPPSPLQQGAGQGPQGSVPGPSGAVATGAAPSSSSSSSSSINKRRSSESIAAGQGDSSAADTTAAGSGAATATGTAQASPSAGGTKRVKSEAAPPKALPERYEQCAVEDMVVLIANMLSELIETNDALALKSGHLTRFHSRTPPGISVLDYLNRLARHATLTPPLLLSMVYYIDRLCAMYPDFTINTLTVHRFLITAATVAAKGLSDAFWNNSTYARVGGVRVAELKMLELEFLYRLEWKIVPNPEVLEAYYRPLVARCPGYVLPPDTAAEQTGHGFNASSNGGNIVNANVNASSSTINVGGHGHRQAERKQSSSTSLIEQDLVVAGLRPAKESG